MDPAVADPHPRSSTPRGESPPARIAALQNPLDRAIYHPLAARLARRLAASRVTPDMLSIAGAVSIILAGIAYVQPGWPLPALLGLILHMSWHVFDGADGDLARLTGRTGPHGEIVDGLCDYAGHLVLYLTLAASAFAEIGWLAWLAIPAGLSRILQQTFHEAQRRRFLQWTHGVAWLGSDTGQVRASSLGGWGAAYLRVAGWLALGDPAIEEGLADPSRRETIRRRLQTAGPSALAGSGLLGSNYRTLALGLSMLAGSPLWYFLYEIVVLNLVLACGVLQSRLTLARMRSAL